MSAKRIRLKQTNKSTYIKSVLLNNGNLVVPRIMKRKPFVAAWVEIDKTDPDFKRWFPKHEKEADPRTLDGYRQQLMENGPEFAWTLEGLYRPR